MGSGYRGLFAGALALALAAPAWAQGTGVISGRVTDRATQRPLGSVQVRIVGTTRGAQTDDAGAYRIINVPEGTVTLAAQRIGYGPQSRTITVTSGTTTADFALAVAATTLDQVVVTATGQSERKRESGVSTATIDSGTVNMATVSTFSDVLSSRAPGVVVQTATGQTGGGSRIRIRGSNSISLSNDPLLIVDGIRVDNSAASQSAATGQGGQVPSRFNDINPEEIENIEVIKGPAAAALYGTAAANGVIQITTKKGRAGKTKWDVYGELGTLNDQNDYPDNFRAFGTTSTNTLTTNCTIYARAAGTCVRVDSVVTNNPLAATNVLQDGNRRTMGASAAGGSDVATYFLSGEYFKEQNVIPINAQQRLNVRTNVRGQLSRTLDAQVNIGFVNSDLRQPQNDNNALGVISGALLGAGYDCGPYGLNAQGRNNRFPTLCLADTTSRGYFNGQVPQEIFNINSRQFVQRLTGSVTSNWTPLSWLAINGTLGADVNNRDDHDTVQPGLVFISQNSIDGYRIVSRARISNYTAGINASGTYEYSPTLRFTTTLGSQYTDVLFNRADATGYKLLAGTNSLGGTNARFAVNEVTNDIRTLGFIGRQQLAWRDRVFLTAGVRTDRNSAFGVNYARVIYPSLSGSWVLSEEEFFPKVAAISSFRLRAAVGSAGQNPGYLAAEQYFNPVAVTVGGSDVAAFTVGGAGNPNLRPEKSTEVEGGFDLGLFEDRVNVEYSHYNKITKDALVNVPIAPSVGSSANRFQNLGRVRNYGDEALIRAAIVNRDDVKFDLSVNGSWNSNHLDDLGVDANGVPITPIVIGSNSTQIIRTGLPLGGYFNRPISYADLNGDGIIGCPGGRGSATCEVTVPDSASYLGSPFPANEIAFTPQLSFGNSVRLSATVDRRGGQKLFNLTHYFRAVSIGNAQEVAVPTVENQADQAAAIGARFASPFTTFAGYIENAAFTKLREVALTLTLPQTLASRVRAGSATLTLAGRNLYTWTNYSGLDPELNSTGASQNFSTADFLTAPQVRQFTARLSLGF